MSFKTSLKIQQRVRETQKLFVDTLEYYQGTKLGFDKAILKRKEENIEFYYGNQWPADIRAERDVKNSPSLTINRCVSAVNATSGNERRNKSEIKPYPFESDDHNLAMVMQYVLKHVHRYYDYDFDNSQGFLTGVACSDAYWEYSIGVGEDGMPTIERELMNPLEVMWDQRSKRYDRKDAAFCIHHTWINKEDVELLLKDKDMTGIDYGDSDDDTEINSSVGKGFDYDNHSSKFEDKGKSRVRLIRLWKVKWEVEYIIRDRESNEVRKLSEKEAKEEDIDLQNNSTFDVKPRLKPRISLHEISGRREISYNDDLQVSRIPVIPFYCFFINGVYFSMIDLAKDRQKQINQFDSILVDYLKRIKKLGAIAEEGVFKNEEQRDAFENSEVGDNLIVDDGVLQNNRMYFPDVHGLELISYFSALKQGMVEDMKDTLGQHDVYMGKKQRAADSGKAIQELKDSSITVQGPIFDNFSRTKRLMAEMELELIQKFFTEEKIERIIGSLAYKYKDEKLISILEQAKSDENERKKLVDVLMTTRYDLVLDEGYNTATIRQFNSLLLKELAQIVPIPPELHIETAPLSEDLKDKWREYMAQAQQMQGQGNIS